MYVQLPQRPEEGIEFSGAVVTGGDEQLCGC